MSDQWDPLLWAMTTISAPRIWSGKSLLSSLIPHQFLLVSVYIAATPSLLHLIGCLANSWTHSQLPSDSLHWRWPWPVLGVIIHTVIVCVLNRFSPVWLFATVARQAPLSMGFSRQEYWSGLPCPPPGDLPDPGIEPASLMSPALAGGFFTTSPSWEGPLFT